MSHVNKSVVEFSILTSSDVIEIGDEPYLIKKNHKEITVIVSEKRDIGIEKTLEKIDDIQMFVLDDAFQHRKLKCKLNIILSKLVSTLKLKTFLALEVSAIKDAVLEGLNSFLSTFKYFL